MLCNFITQVDIVGIPKALCCKNEAFNYSNFIILTVISGWAASASRSTRCWGQVRGQLSEEWEFLFWESFHQWKQILRSAPCKYFLCCLLYSVNPRSPDIRTPPLPFQSVSPTCAPLNPSHHQGVVGVIICLIVICPPLHLSCQQLWGLRSRATGLFHMTTAPELMGERLGAEESTLTPGQTALVWASEAYSLLRFHSGFFKSLPPVKDFFFSAEHLRAVTLHLNVEVRERQCGCVCFSWGYYLIEDKLWLKRSDRGLSLWLHYSPLIWTDFLFEFRGEVLTARLYSPLSALSLLTQRKREREKESGEVVTSSSLNQPSSFPLLFLRFLFFFP